MLVDTSVWVDHLRRGNAKLAERLERAEVWCHPFIIGELACGRLRNRETILSLLQALPRVPTADHDEVLTFIAAHRLMGAGIAEVCAKAGLDVRTVYYTQHPEPVELGWTYYVHSERLGHRGRR